MENEGVMRKGMMMMKVETPESMINNGGLARQGSITKHNCLCSPTIHAGSFRCRLHRSPSLQRTKSIDSSEAKVANNNA